MRKREYMLLFLVATAFSAVQGQYAYKPFRVDMGLGWSFSIHTYDENSGINLGIEPKYTFADRFSVGMRLEWSRLTNTHEELVYSELKTEIYTHENKMSTALTPTFDYHFTTGTFRPFVGAGLGVYFVNGVRHRTKHFTDEEEYMGRTSSAARASAVNPGFMFRAGFDVAHFRLSLAYNHAGRSDHGMRHHYVAFTVGGYIGGGKIRKIYPDQKR